MIIKSEICNGCGLCEPGCHRKAISRDASGKYVIDAAVCNECEDIYEVECIRFCDQVAIRRNDGSVQEYDDSIYRVRPEHIIWTMALWGSRGNLHGSYPTDQVQWKMYRKIAAEAFLDPHLKIRITPVYDEICIGCGARQDPGHPAKYVEMDNMCFEVMGVKPGTVMELWDAVRIIEATFTSEHIKKLSPIPEDIYNDFIAYLSPGAKLLQERANI